MWRLWIIDTNFVGIEHVGWITFSTLCVCMAIYLLYHLTVSAVSKLHFFFLLLKQCVKQLNFKFGILYEVHVETTTVETATVER